MSIDPTVILFVFIIILIDTIEQSNINKRISSDLSEDSKYRHSILANIMVLVILGYHLIAYFIAFLRTR